VAKFDEIITIGSRFRDAGTQLLQFIYPPGALREGSDSDLIDYIEPYGTKRAFVPPVLPQPLVEIIVSAQRPPPPSGLSLGTVNMSSILRGLGWIGLAGYSVYWLEEQRRERLKLETEEAKREAAARKKQKLLEEGYIETLPEPEFPAPEYEVLPFPILPDPYADPTFAPTVVPRTMPQPQPAPVVRPLVQPLPVTIPQPNIRPLPATTPQPFPQVAPRPATRPMPFPQPSPWANPLTSPQPATQPQPWAQPQPQPAGGTRRLTQTQRSVRRSTQRATATQGALLAGSANCRCPETKEKEKKPRTECWKKLVKEGLFEDWDESYNWTRIDCITGREL